MPGRSTMEPIFCEKQLIEKYREEKKFSNRFNLYRFRKGI